MRTSLHPSPKATEEHSQMRQATLPTTQPDQDYVRAVERLKALGESQLQVPENPPISYRVSSHRHLLAMCPEPNHGAGVFDNHSNRIV